MAIIQLTFGTDISHWKFDHQENSLFMETKNDISTKDTKASELKFEAVKYMREQRDVISKELFELTPEQILKHFENIKNSTDIRPSA